MLNLKVFEDEKTSKEVMLQLFSSADGINVAVVDRDGDRIMGGNLVTFCKEGYLMFHGAISRDFGFELDNDSRIVTYNV